MAKLIEVNKTGKARALKRAPTFAEAQAHVGGFIETVTLPGVGVLLVNEDGLSKGLPLNLTASRLAGKPLVGNVVLLETKADIKRTLGD